MLLGIMRHKLPKVERIGAKDNTTGPAAILEMSKKLDSFEKAPTLDKYTDPVPEPMKYTDPATEPTLSCM